ncbi:MAG: type II toxin-antitoxin system VapC family toxin [Erysipelotrichaceae bacterium]|nr:type II toxin-antitoxin system VapC family toxin [Erysipelotrichaceae bacterium]
MRILLDTHILLWALAGSDRIDEKTKELILDPDNEIYYSTVSPWECEIKHRKHPEMFKVTAEQLLFLCRQAEYENLSILDRHVRELQRLDGPEHRDPFDRMLLAQARAENMILITHDKKFTIHNDPHIYYC